MTMAEVKWIKIVTDIFDDEKTLLIESMPESDSIIVIWFKLLCMAGKMNNNGVFVMNNRIPYTDEMLATVFRRPLNTVRLALATFEQYGMIKIVDNVVTIPNWEKHQNIDGLEKMREQNRKRVAAYREKQKLLAAKQNEESGKNQCNVTVQKSNAIDKNKNRIREDKNIYTQIKDLYNETCVSFPRLTVLSDKRKQAIKARLNVYTVDQMKAVFEKAEASTFLKGGNNRNWSANFDWLLKDSNFAKVLDGNYDDKFSTYSGYQKPVEQSNNIFADMLREGEGEPNERY
jgi:predicted phage replisome organizer